MGFASSPATRNALAPYGIRATGYRWKWGLGLKGGTFPPHRDMNGQISGIEGFGVSPGEDVNGDSCMCWLVPAYRTPDGRLAKADLTPAFLPPVTASTVEVFKPEPLDLEPLGRTFAETLAEAFAQPQPVNVNVAIPDGAIVVNVTTPTPQVTVEPTVNVPAPVVNVEAPSVTVEPAVVNVEAPVVNVEPRIDVKPTPVKVVKERAAKRVRFRRNNEGRIEEADVE